MPSLYRKFQDLLNMPKEGWYQSDLRDLDGINYGIGDGCLGDSPSDHTLREYLMPSHVKFIEGKWDRYFGGGNV